jgi:PEP-CTERM motif
VIPSASLTSCTYVGTVSGALPCANQEFLFGIVPGFLNVSFGTPGRGIFYYFDTFASSTNGTFNTVFFGTDQQGILETTIGRGGVPEPASWAMLIAGFGLVGAARRRQRITVSA